MKRTLSFIAFAVAAAFAVRPGAQQPTASSCENATSSSRPGPPA